MTEGATVYILRWDAVGRLRVGITRRTIEDRPSEHAQGISKGYTARRRPVDLPRSEYHERADEGADEGAAAERRVEAGRGRRSRR